MTNTAHQTWLLCIDIISFIITWWLDSAITQLIFHFWYIYIKDVWRFGIRFLFLDLFDHVYVIFGLSASTVIFNGNDYAENWQHRNACYKHVIYIQIQRGDNIQFFQLALPRKVTLHDFRHHHHLMMTTSGDGG